MLSRQDEDTTSILGRTRDVEVGADELTDGNDVFACPEEVRDFGVIVGLGWGAKEGIGVSLLDGCIKLETY